VFRITLNLCLVGRCIRFALETACLDYGLFENTVITNHIVAPIIDLFGTVNLFASVAASCPVYTLCGVSSLKQSPIKDAGEHQG